jgi:phosphinothricin acetyltransferase
MAPHVRRAEPDDAPRIAQIYNAGIAERDSTFETRPREAADVLAWLDSGERLPVLVAGAQEVCGWARVDEYSLRPAYAGVGEVSIYVDREARGQGMGSALLEELSHRAAKLGY